MSRENLSLGFLSDLTQVIEYDQQLELWDEGSRSSVSIVKIVGDQLKHYYAT